MQININKLNDIAREAGRGIMDIYESDTIEVEYKDDKSPLTQADLASHTIIKDHLTALYPEIPIISEEGKNIPYEQRKEWNRFWLVDPLDGTKEFVKRNGEFTVNIALVENNRPILGVIFAPALDVLYFADKVGGAFKQMKGSQPERMTTRSGTANLVAIQSRSHSSSAEEEFFSKFSISNFISKGSSLKFCLVAESTADIYFRSGPTWEWDTAAGHAIVTIAGGTVIIKERELEYNKPTLKNDDGFVCVGNANLLNA